jgi:hypothetical protein
MLINYWEHKGRYGKKEKKGGDWNVVDNMDVF